MNRVANISLFLDQRMRRIFLLGVISGFPWVLIGSSLSLWLKEHNFKPDQVQTFYPSPMALATAMYYSERNPLERVRYKTEKIPVIKNLDERQRQKAFLRYHDEKNWPMLRNTLKEMGRADLIGNKDHHLVPYDSVIKSKSRFYKGKPNKR